jgi:hypothetical protein
MPPFDTRPVVLGRSTGHFHERSSKSSKHVIAASSVAIRQAND